MLQFGDLEVVEKTFTREGGAVRTQAYNGIKFRRYESEKGKKAAEKKVLHLHPSLKSNLLFLIRLGKL